MEQIIKDYPFSSVLSFRPLIDYLKGSLADSDGEICCHTINLEDMLRQAPEFYEPIEDLTLLERHKALVKRLMSLVFPPAYWETEAFAAMIPFSIRPVFVSPQFQRLLLNEDGSFKGRRNVDDESFNRGRVMRAYLFILKRFYGFRPHFGFLQHFGR